jgi:N-acetyl-1-D-myo-inositol-2-amino-2-deoxy-alpha-D-glucopyranoside deacetylase
VTPTSGGLLAVHAHPDDETLATGGLLATWAAAGRPVTLVTCTRGERGEVVPPALAALEGDGPALAAHRTAELAEAMRRLGVRDHLFLDEVPGDEVRGDDVLGDDVPGDVGHSDDVPATSGPAGAPGARGARDAPVGQRYEDSGMAWLSPGRAGTAADGVPAGAFVTVPVDVAAARLARVLRDRRPDVVVTYEPGGGYGHPDHVHAHRVATRAVELAARPGPAGEPPHTVAAVLWTAVPDDVLRAALAGLAELPVARAVRAVRPTLVLPDPRGPLPSVAVGADEVALQVDVTPVQDRVAHALRAHATQVGSVALGPPQPLPGGAGLAGCYALSNDVLAPLLTAESYRYAPGSPRSAVAWPPGVRQVA